MQKAQMMYEGKAKKVYATDDDRYVIVSYKDDATAFNGQKKGTIVGKGVVNNKMSNYLMQMLEKNGVKTDYVEELNDRETVLKRLKSFLWRLLSATRQPAAFPSVSALLRELN